MKKETDQKQGIVAAKELSWKQASWILAGGILVVATALSAFLATGIDRMVVAAPGVPTITWPTHQSMTNNRSPLISGNATPGEGEVTVHYSDGITFCTAPVAASGAWSCSRSLPLSEDVYIIYATQGASDGTRDVEFTVDLSSEAPTIFTPAEGYQTDNARPVISGGASEWFTTITILIDGYGVGTTRPDINGWQWTFTPSANLAAGQHTVTAIAKDDAGNVSEPSAGRTFTITSTAPPVVPPANPPAAPPAAAESASNNNNRTTTISGTGTAGNSVTARDETGKVLCTATVQADGTWSCASAESVAGELSATETDGEGNETPVSATVVEEEIESADSDVSAEVDAADAKSGLSIWNVVFSIVGATMIAAAISLLVAKRRKSKQESSNKGK